MSAGSGPWGHLRRRALEVFGRTPPRFRRLVVRAVAPKYTVGATCWLLRDDGRVLLVRQSYRDRWGLPGGLLARGEDPEVAVVREVAEETGLDVELTSGPAVVVEPGHQRIDLVFRARPRPGVDPDQVRPCRIEIVACAWFALGELPDLQIEAAAGRAALEALGSGGWSVGPHSTPAGSPPAQPG